MTPLQTLTTAPARTFVALRDSASALADKRGKLRYPPVNSADEDREVHEIDEILADPGRFDEALSRYGEAVRRQGLLTSSQPRKIGKIQGMGVVWDYRHMTIPNGGVIKLEFGVQHIPVIRQMTGRADLDLLRQVLIAQGLMIQTGTDGEGNVAIYTNLNRLCYHARGANSFSYGTEHMHYLTSEPWSEKQLNAAAYLLARAKRYHGVPMHMAALAPGLGNVGFTRRGQTSHKEVSAKAGFFDRSDPGDGYPWAEVRERAIRYYRTRKF
jgi:hypothetical protein